MTQYFRPIVQTDETRPPEAVPIGGGWCWFDHAEVLQRGRVGRIVPASEIPEYVRKRISAARPAIAGVTMDQPRLMGILNATPDSFSDGGSFETKDAAIQQGHNLVAEGADFLDIGGESTRPGAAPVAEAEEIARIQPVIKVLSGKNGVPISADTRKSTVAGAALAAGAKIINDVSALRFDPQLADITQKNQSFLCLMHSLATPETMQDQADYDDVLLDVYDHLAERIDLAVQRGNDRRNIIVDPGIGFGKTAQHNLTLMRGLSLLHGLGCPILLGVSRKRFIGTIGHAPDPMARMPGSVALALCGFAQGVQIMRVHDMAETKQALRLWLVATGKGQSG